MATEKRLIDADAFIEWYCEECGQRCELDKYCCLTVSDLRDAPTVDAVDIVKVVRCKDCKFYKDSPMGGKGCHTHYNGRTEFIPKNDNDFCSYGRRKERR